MQIYQQQDCDRKLIQDKVIGMIGFGTQGRAHAQNLRDSGIKVIVGLHQQSKSIKFAKEIGFEVFSVTEVVLKSDLIVFMIPDELHQEIFEKEVKPYLHASHTLVFCHGFSIHFNFVRPPKNVGVIMIAPKAQGRGVRDAYLRDSGVPAFIAVQQENHANNAYLLALSYAANLGCDKSFIMETTFEKETQSDLFGEQAVLCGGLKTLIKNAFETLVDAGFPKELAYFECLHELKLVVDLIYEGGLTSLHQNISNTAEYGMIISEDSIASTSIKRVMQELLEKIKDGSFAKEFILEKQNGYKRIQNERDAMIQHSIEIVGKQLRQKIFNQSQK